MTKEEHKYAEYLTELYDAPDYGFLLYKGDPIQFDVGFHEWEREQAQTN